MHIGALKDSMYLISTSSFHPRVERTWFMFSIITVQCPIYPQVGFQIDITNQRDQIGQYN